ncbi:hypothetical protein C2U31_10360 [Achromobacter sp. AONIH1]|nr:hypothetical protein C2U31_10360 [Achromobacter sp. AONIH1]
MMNAVHQYGAPYASSLMAVKRAIEAGNAPDDSAIPSWLVQSWLRSRSHGLRLGDHRLVDRGYSPHLLNEQDRDLSAIVGEEIEAIWDSFGGENWVAYCTNAQGVIIRAKHGSNPASRGFALHVGRRILESDTGTTAPSCALKEKKPITLIGAEHYLDEFLNMFCCAVPIWGGWGKVVGILNVTGSEEFKSRLVERKLLSAAIKIENRLFLDAHKENSVFRIHYDADFIDTHLAGLVSVNKFGDVLSVTRNALEMFDQADVLHKRYSVSDLFYGDFVVAGDFCLKSHMKNGIVLYTKSCNEHSASVLNDSAAVRANGSLRELSDLHILEVMRKSGGNVSKAAEILNLSRTTIYRVLSRNSEK